MNFYPEAASEWAAKVDLLHGYINAWSLFFTVVVFAGVIAFAVIYRRKSDSERPRAILGSLKLELFWSITPLLISMTMFAWAAWLFFDYAAPPANAMEIYVTGKQWMFYTQHPEGQREINELHVPTGRPIKLTMSSEDVIHSFFVPAFRVKRDVVPGRYSTIWFTPTKKGKYRLFCAEYCGTEHSLMGGWVYVMEPAEYEGWLASGGFGSMATQGEKLFSQLGCSSCHRMDQQGRGPNLTNVYGTHVELQTGESVLADPAYVRESILQPDTKLAAGFQNIMPTYQGQVNEQNLVQLIAYIKSLSKAAGTSGAGAGGAAGGVGQRSAAPVGR